jgi:glyoxylase-like metal-dependent hydrolase (beta-lactamase superfamily II)
MQERANMADHVHRGNVKLPHFEGWHLIGAFEDNVGSWLLMDDGEALLLEVPEGLTVGDVRKALADTKTKLRYVTASHDHWDHLDRNVWGELAGAFPRAKIVHPASVRGDRQLQIGSEVVWLVAAPKHSLADVVTVFRGVAMTGDIEIGMLESVTDEVPLATRRKSMRRLQEFQDRTGYHVHTTVSAHLNSLRVSVNWPELFRF